MPSAIFSLIAWMTFSGRPESDPHGDPIPARDGELRGEGQQTTPLVESAAGSQIRFCASAQSGFRIPATLERLGP